jgi:hypothetical protein
MGGATASDLMMVHRRVGDVSVLLHSQLLQFCNNGRLLACVDANAVTVVDTEVKSAPARIEQRGVAAIALFASQVWTLDEQRAQLRRYLPDGSLLSAARDLAVAPCSAWLVATAGGPGVLMQGTGRKWLVERGGELVETAVPAAAVAIPIAAGRHVFCGPDRIVPFGGGINAHLRGDVVPVGGAAVSKNASAVQLVMIVADGRGEYGAILFDTNTGRMRESRKLVPGKSGAMRGAAQRALLVVHTSERQFALADIATGGIELVEAPVDVDDFAIDPVASKIAIRCGELVRIYPLWDLSPVARPELEIDTSVQPRHPASAPACDPEPMASAKAAGESQPNIPRLPHVRDIALPQPSADPDVERVAMIAGAPPPAPITVERLQVLPGGTATAETMTPSSALRDRSITTRASLSSEPPSGPRTPPTSPRGAPADVKRQQSVDLRTSGGANTAVIAGPLEPRVVELFQLRGFGPPPKRLAITRHDAARVLIGELRWIELRTLLAIAHGWDTGRIAYANEGRYPQELEAAAILAGNAAGGHAQDHVEATRAALVEHERALANDASRGTDATPLGALAAELQLSPLATKILLVIAGPTLRGELRRLYGILANDATRAPVDELLVEQILGDSPEARSDIAHELRPNGPLCGYGLVHVERHRARPHAGLAVDPVVVARLRAEPFELGPGAATSIRAADRAVHELLLPSELVLDAMRYLSQPPGEHHQVRIAVRGPVGSGRRTLLAAITHKAGRELAIIDLMRLPRSPDEFALALRTELRRALLSGLVPCLTRLDELAKGSDDPVRVAVQDVVRSHPGPAGVHLGVRERVPLDPDHLLLDLKPPTESERLEVWRDALAKNGLSVATPEVLAARYRVGPGTIRRAARAVADARAGQGRLAGDVFATLEAHMRQTREARFGEQAKWVERLAPWSTCVLPEDIEYSLRELIARVRHRRTVFDQWGFDRVITSARGVTALFEGPPGTGKTLVAGAIARELGLDLYRIDLSATMSKWIGETEKNLGAIFDAAEDGQVMLLFDEADSLFTKRTEVKSSVDRYANLEVNYLLQRLDAFEGFAILTTNLGTAIDPAFKRRLSFRLTFPFPDAEARERLWRVHLPSDLPVDGRLDLDSLARKYELSGGYIRNACLRAAFLAAEAGGPLSQQHLERAVELEFAEVGKLSSSGRME